MSDLELAGGTARSGTVVITGENTPVSVVVSPASPSIVELATQAFTVVVRNAANDIITPSGGAWSSLTPSVATINSSTGVATGVAIGGPVTIRYTVGGVTGDAALSVTILTTPATVTVSPSAPTVAVPATQQFTAVVKNANNTVIPGAAVSWSSLDASRMTVNGTGLGTAVTAGAVTIRATSGAVHGDAAVTVTPAPIQPIFFDDFGRPDGALGVSDSGHAWLDIAGDFAIENGQLRPTVVGTGSEDNRSATVVDLLRSNVLFEAVYATIGFGRIVARLLDKDNQYYSEAAAPLWWWKKMLASVVNYAGVIRNDIALNPGDRLRAYCIDNVLILGKNETVIGAHTDADLNTATKFGIGESGSLTARWDTARAWALDGTARRLVISGNSIVAGYGATSDANGFAAKLRAAKLSGTDVLVLGHPDRTYGQMSAFAAQDVDAVFSAARQSERLFSHESINSFKSAGEGNQNGAATWPFVRDWVRGRKLVHTWGGGVYVGTCLGHGTFNNTEIGILNGLIRSNAVAEGYTVVDFAADARLFPYNAAYMTDDVHPNNAGHQAMYDICVAAGLPVVP